MKYRLRITTTHSDYRLDMNLECWDKETEQEHQQMVETMIHGLRQGGYLVEATREHTLVERL